MIPSAILQAFKAVAIRLQSLRKFLEKYEIGSPRGSVDQEFDYNITDSINVIKEVQSAIESAEFESLGRNTQRRLRIVSRHLAELASNLAELQIKVRVYTASKVDAWTEPAMLSTRSALLAAIKFTQQDIVACENRLPVFSTYYAADGKVVDATSRSDLELDGTLGHDEELRPIDINHAAGAVEELLLPEATAVLDAYLKEPPRPIPCRLVPVMFATERQKEMDSNPLHVKFSNGRGKGTMIYGVAEVSIPPGHKRGRLERPVLWKLQFREDPEKHITIISCEEKDLATWKAIAHERIKDAGTNAALLFIHGFNVSFDEAIRRTAQIGWDLNFHGLITAFSWCSEGEVLSYITDESNARLAVPRFIEFLRMLQKELGVNTVHIIAHSMGNLVLIEALRKMVVFHEGSYPLEEVILAAPDFDADEFKAAVHELKGKARRYTLYGSEKDLALVASKKLRSDYPRAGDGGKNMVVVEGIESIDATSVGEDLLGLGHSYFSSKRTLLSDIHYVINESLPPSRRDGLSTVRMGSLWYWVFQP